MATTSPEGCDDTGAATSALRSRERVIADALGTTAEPICLTDLAQLARAGALRTTAAILAPDTGKELRPGEAVQIRYAHLIRFLSAGIDFIKFYELIATIPIVGNGGVRMRDLDTLLAAPDMPIISTPLPLATRDLIDTRELALCYV